MVRGQVISSEEKAVERRALPISVNTELHNRFDIEVLGSDGKIKQQAVAYNIILDALWTRLSTSAAWFAAISYGSGTGTLAASRTDLFTRVGTKTAGSLVVDYSHFQEGYVSFRKNIQIDAGEITGQTLREVGISYDTSANHLMTHATLKDMNGNAISITIGALDVIRIYATVFVRFNPSGYEGGGVFFTPVIAADTFLHTVAGVGASTFMNLLYYLYVYSGEPPVGCKSNPANKVGADYTPGNIGSKAFSVSYNAALKRILARCSLAAGTSFRISTTQLNPADKGGWRGASYRSVVNTFTDICIRFPNDAKPYCTITDEAVGTGDGSKLDFPTNFGFILNDGSFVLKANGASISPADYTVDYGKPAHNKIWFFLKSLDATNKFIRTDSLATAAGDYEIVENPLYANYGITSFYAKVGVQVECSNDLTNWVTVKAAATATGTINVNATYQKYRYWKISTPSAQSSISDAFKDAVSADITANPIHFVAGHAPATGAAITASYHTASIAKDTNHVVDLELEITLGEYTP